MNDAWTATCIIAGPPDRPRRESPLLLLGEGTAAFAHSLLSHVLLRGERAVVLDGAGGFDPGRLAAVTQERQRTIPTLLTAVRVIRTTGWRPWLDLLTHDAEAEARRSGSRWIFALGLLDQAAGPGVAPYDARRGAGTVASAVLRLAQAGLGVVAAQDRRVLADAGRIDLLEPLLRRGLTLLEVAPARGEDRPNPAFEESEPEALAQLSFGFGAMGAHVAGGR